jgi:hypothetical protein
MNIRYIEKEKGMYNIKATMIHFEGGYYFIDWYNGNTSIGNFEYEKEIEYTKGF